MSGGFGLCWACGNEAEEKHHILPRRFGGKDIENLVPLCRLCHDHVDRVPLKKWPADEMLQAWSELARTTAGKRLLLKLMALLGKEKA